MSVMIEISTLAKGLQQQASKQYTIWGVAGGERIGSESLFGQLRIKITI